MGEQGGSEFGPTAPATPAAAPFSVSGPSAVTLDASRHGTTSFVVANITGRPVNARLLVQPLDGADPAWFTLDGPIERPMAVAATLTTELRVDVPPKAPAGQHGVRLDVALEDSPDRVTSGPTAVFTVPEPDKKRFPWWIIAVVVGALLVIGGGVWAILALTGPKAPTSTAAPVISGTAEAGQELTVADGAWDPENVVLFHVWQACPGDSDGIDPDDCTDIVISTDGDEVKAAGSSFVAGADQLGMRLRVREVAVNTDPDSFEGDVEDLADLPQATSYSAVTDAVAPAPVTTVEVPGVEGSSLSAAQAALAAAGLQVLPTFAGSGDDCDPIVADQNPGQGQIVEIGSAVAITAPAPPPLFQCLEILPLPIDILPDFVIDPGGP